MRTTTPVEECSAKRRHHGCTAHLRHYDHLEGGQTRALQALWRADGQVRRGERTPYHPLRAIHKRGQHRDDRRPAPPRRGLHGVPHAGGWRTYGPSVRVKWFTYVTVVLVSGAVLDFTISEPTGVQWLGEIGFVLTMVGLAGLPIAIGSAVLRYRLYNIDVIINRTLVYGSLTATLVALYFGGIVLLQRVFVLTGEKSTLAVVASTLLIAALFNPLRRRIQSFIDRSFYRTKYDARKTLEGFSSKLRNETDLKALRATTW